MNGGTPYLVPWPAMHLPLPAHLSKLTGLPHMQPQQFTLPQFTHFTLPGGQVYPINQMTLPPTLFTQNMVTHLPKIIMPPTVTFISLLIIFFLFWLTQSLWCVGLIWLVNILYTKHWTGHRVLFKVQWVSEQEYLNVLFISLFKKCCKSLLMRFLKHWIFVSLDNTLSQRLNFSELTVSAVWYCITLS